MKDFSIVIASRGDPIGLWFTIHSIEAELAGSKYDYEYCLCINGEKDSRDPSKTLLCAPPIINYDTERCLKFLSKTGKLGYCKVLQRSVSPPQARQYASERAQGKYIFFFDNHCIVAKDYFRRSLADLEHYGMDMLHSTTRFFEGELDAYHYKLKLKETFWAESAAVPPIDYKPYKVACGGHGGFVVNAETWRELGGYYCGFEGYGGEELTTDLSWWMQGKTVYLDPKVIHYHWSGARGYARHHSYGYYLNLMMSANIIGGEKWLWKVYESFSKQQLNRNVVMHDVLLDAYGRSVEERDRLQSVAQIKDLDELLLWFNQEVIVYK